MSKFAIVCVTKRHIVKPVTKGCRSLDASQPINNIFHYLEMCMFKGVSVYKPRFIFVEIHETFHEINKYPFDIS